MDINELLKIYKDKVDFSDRQQKSNFKFVESYVSYNTKKLIKDPNHWEKDCTIFVQDAIKYHEDYVLSIKKINDKFKGDNKNE